MNNQEFFDKTMAHLRQQKTPCFKTIPTRISGEPHNACVYTDGQGKHCAVGVHIPEKLLGENPTELVVSVGTLINDFPEIRALFADLSVSLMADMQGLHDVATPKIGSLAPRSYDTFEGLVFERRAENIARSYSLKYTPPADA